MKHFYLAVVVASICLCLAGKPSFAEESKADKPKIHLRAAPSAAASFRFGLAKEDNMALSRHFTRFRHAIETGELILAGRTKEPGDKTFGIARGCVVATALCRRNERENPPSVKRRQSGVATIYQAGAYG
ncbi:MAG: hypothetical protein QOJ05_774 [Verrucomicrobiota bacterium]|jgi:hypothetical protein